MTELLQDLFNIGNGVRSGVQDVPSLFKNILELDGHGIVTDSRKLIGDVGDVLGGVESLGLNLGKAPAKYAGSVGKLADSPILSGAQLAIEGEKALTGSGEPQGGDGYGQSAVKLQETVETLISAEVNPDAWDGAASREYDTRSKEHRSKTSAVATADGMVGTALNDEAGQVSRTRETLDTTSQGLYDYGLATAWMNFVPGLNVAKWTADTIAAAGALATTNTAMLILANNALVNGMRIRSSIDAYNEAAKDTSGRDDCGTFVDPSLDQGGNLPTRLHPETTYRPPKPTVPPQYGPPATHYGTGPGK